MLGSAVFVLTALTMTGVYVKGTDEKEKNDGYTIDFSALEDSAENKTAEIEKEVQEVEEQTAPSGLTASAKDNNETSQIKQSDVGTKDDMKRAQTATKSSDLSKDDFMDYLPSVEGENLAADAGSAESTESEDPIVAQAAEFSEIDDEGESIATAGEAVTNVTQPALDFTENDTLVWPIVGNVLINYSMDKSTYFATLDQYKYSPAIVIGATEGETITAAADGKVVKIYEDEEIGNAVVMDLGGGYQLTYGQLKDIQVSEGSYVKTGEVVGNVAAPTKYYSVEGANVYFMLTKDGTPVIKIRKIIFSAVLTKL